MVSRRKVGYCLIHLVPFARCILNVSKAYSLDSASLMLRSAHLRQTLLLSTYLTPEISSLFSHSLLNRAGKLKALKTFEGGNTLSRVPEGLKQVWTRFEAVGVEGEEEKRWEWFVNKVSLVSLRYIACLAGPSQY